MPQHFLESGYARSIPARAGEPQRYRSDAYKPCRWVYPRACGGTGGVTDVASPPNGLSPRVRGNRSTRWTVEIDDRVYPRACGGTR